MDAGYINPILEAMQGVFASTVKIDFQVGQPRLKTSAVAKGDITGFIDISSEKEVGSISLTFRRPLLFEVARTLLEEDYDEITHEVSDCVAELTNLICGHAKSTLSQRGYQFELRPPMVITGQEHRVYHPCRPTIYLPFVSIHGPLYVEFSCGPVQ